MVHYRMSLVVLLLSTLLVFSCSKEKETTNEVTLQEKSSSYETLYYHYRGNEYPLKTTGNGMELIPDESSEAFEIATSESLELFAFKMPHYSDDHIFFFDSRFEGYDFLEKDFDALIGRKFKFSYRITNYEIS